jgi:hypothetical protein
MLAFNFKYFIFSYFCKTIRGQYPEGWGTGRGSQGIKVFKNKVLRKMLGCKNYELVRNR